MRCLPTSVRPSLVRREVISQKLSKKDGQLLWNADSVAELTSFPRRPYGKIRPMVSNVKNMFRY